MRALFSVILLALLFASNAFAENLELRAPQEVPTRWTFEDWETDFTRAIIPFWDVTNVIGRDNIPSIDDPLFENAAGNKDIPRNEPVIAFEKNGDARAYPLRIMMWHEIVNDVVDGTPVAVTYCPLCNTSIVFDRHVNGEAVTFGTTGKLRNSDLIMYDRTSQTWWQQFNGVGLVGTHAGTKLKSYPSRLMSLELFLEEYPQGKMLRPDPRRLSSLGRNPYAGYDSNPDPFLFKGELPEDINAMVRVILVQGDTPFAVALPKLQREETFTHEGIIFTWKKGQASALDRPEIASGRDIGNIDVRDQNGALVTHEITFAFAARAFLPKLKIIQ